MCQAHEDDLDSVLQRKLDLKGFRKCLKCEKNSVILTRINDPLCKECFLEYFTHKFRATIGKNKLFEKDEPVFFPYSASSSSVAMLDLIAKGASEEAKKKFTFKPAVLYIEDSLVLELKGPLEPADFEALRQRRLQRLREVEESVKHARLKVYYSLLENSFEDENNNEACFFESVDAVKFDAERLNKFLALMNDISGNTSRGEMAKRLRLKLIGRIAKVLGFVKVIFAITCTKLTVDLISNVAIGKGAHLSVEAALEEKRPDGLVFVRPLRELTSKEVAFYNFYSGINDRIFPKSSSSLSGINSTIYRLTEKFINSLQNEYPTTVATIFRTSDKLTPIEELKSDSVADLCRLCQAPIDTRINESLANAVGFSSALNDLAFSKYFTDLQTKSSAASNEPSEGGSCGTDSGEGCQSGGCGCQDSKGEAALFKKFCYSCSIIINDLADKSRLPKELVSSREERFESMRNEIKDFLLDQDE